MIIAKTRLQKENIASELSVLPGKTVMNKCQINTLYVHQNYFVTLMTQVNAKNKHALHIMTAIPWYVGQMVSAKSVLKFPIALTEIKSINALMMVHVPKNFHWGYLAVLL
jgi:hypothetical protein